MGRTKKVSDTGRFGPRYGVGIRKRILKIEQKQKKKFACPACGAEKVKRLAAGMFTCTKCGHKFAGGAYVPETLPGGAVKKMVAQKSFSQGLEEIIETEEEQLEGTEEQEN
ncbi:MAG: 50S ribosomal protein L37ae [Candidatus Diapherotrites archaeon]|nr:50S ribosomal protein L37ae [Candidatus Diapherotrites archaeon]